MADDRRDGKPDSRSRRASLRRPMRGVLLRPPDRRNPRRDRPPEGEGVQGDDWGDARPPSREDPRDDGFRPLSGNRSRGPGALGRARSLSEYPDSGLSPGSDDPVIADASGNDPAGASDSGWIDVRTRLYDLSGPRPLSYAEAWDWDLVLQSAQIAHRVESEGGTWRITVPVSLLDEAERELRAYAENPETAPAPCPPPLMADNDGTTLAVLVCLALFHIIVRTPGFGYDTAWWFDHGSARSGSILAGNIWRCLTALSLHADVEHLLGNALLGGVIFRFTCRELGTGLGWSAVLASGFFGNWFNAHYHGWGHDSVGASTAVFGAVGVLVGLRIVRDRGRTLRDILVPAGAGFALLAFFGMGGESGRHTTDISAHVLGFLCGLPLGGLTALAVRDRQPLGGLSSHVLTALAFLSMPAAWLIVFL